MTEAAPAVWINSEDELCTGLDISEAPRYETRFESLLSSDSVSSWSLFLDFIRKVASMKVVLSPSSPLTSVI